MYCSYAMLNRIPDQDLSITLSAATRRYERSPYNVTSYFPRGGIWYQWEPADKTL